MTRSVMHGNPHLQVWGVHSKHCNREASRFSVFTWSTAWISGPFISIIMQHLESISKWVSLTSLCQGSEWESPHACGSLQLLYTFYLNQGASIKVPVNNVRYAGVNKILLLSQAASGFKGLRTHFGSTLRFGSVASTISDPFADCIFWNLVLQLSWRCSTQISPGQERN